MLLAVQGCSRCGSRSSSASRLRLRTQGAYWGQTYSLPWRRTRDPSSVVPWAHSTPSGTPHNIDRRPFANCSIVRTSWRVTLRNRRRWSGSHSGSHSWPFLGLGHTFSSLLNRVRLPSENAFSRRAPELIPKLNVAGAAMGPPGIREPLPQVPLWVPPAWLVYPCSRWPQLELSRREAMSLDEAGTPCQG